VTIVDSANNRLGGVVVTGIWASVLPAAGWPFQGNATTALGGTSLGQAVLTAANKLPSARRNGCSFTVAAAAKAGYALSSAGASARSTW
jgi:hypothetical protein